MSRCCTNSRTIAYIDGFNLFYGIKAASKKTDSDRITKDNGRYMVGKSLYWLDIPRLIRSYRVGENLSQTRYFAAPRIVPSRVAITDEERDEYISSNERQMLYIDALRQLPGFDDTLGHYIEKPPFRCVSTCNCGTPCGHTNPRYEEKLTDTHMATQMVLDCCQDRFDLAIVVSADADLVPPIKAVRDLGKKVVVMFPPERNGTGHLQRAATESLKISFKQCRKNQLPDSIPRGPYPTIQRPDEWTKPANGVWVWDPNSKPAVISV